MRPRKKTNLEPRLLACAAVIIQSPMAHKGQIAKQFPNPSAPLHLELGCGKGRFICDLARQHPEINFIAIERERNVAVSAAERAMHGGHIPEAHVQAPTDTADTPDAATTADIADTTDTANTPDSNMPPAIAPLANLRLMLVDADTLGDIFCDGELARMYINFCDPWHKRRQYKNRLTYRERLQIYHRLLASGAELQFKTDNYMLYHFSTFEFAAVMPAYFSTTNLHASEYNKDNVVTEYEAYFSALNQPIYSIRAKKE